MYYFQLRNLFICAITIILSLWLMSCSGKNDSTNPINSFAQGSFKKDISSKHREASRYILNAFRDVTVTNNLEGNSLNARATNRYYSQDDEENDRENFVYDFNEPMPEGETLVSSYIAFYDDPDPEHPQDDLIFYLTIDSDGDFWLHALEVQKKRHISDPEDYVVIEFQTTKVPMLSHICKGVFKPIFAYGPEDHVLYRINIPNNEEDMKLVQVYNIPDDEVFEDLYFDQKLELYVLTTKKIKEKPEDPDQLIVKFSSGEGWSSEPPQPE